MPDRIGLVAGRGSLPYEVLQEIKHKQEQVVVVGLKGEVNSGFFSSADYYQEVPPGHLEEIIQIFTSQGAQEVVFAGKVGKDAIFTEGFDPTFQRLLNSIPQKNDDAILLALVMEFEKNGLKVAKQTDYLRKLLAAPGVIIGQPTETELADLKLGFQMAKAIGGLDIGQSVVVKQGVVLAVEAIEGTDQAIIRGGALGGSGAVVVKVSKPNQDERFDVPTIGRSTIESLIKAQAAVLGIEAGKTLVVEKEELLSLAARNQIKIIAI